MEAVVGNRNYEGLGRNEGMEVMGSKAPRELEKCGKSKDCRAPELLIISSFNLPGQLY